MDFEDRVLMAGTKDIVINEFMKLDEEDIKNGTKYKIKIRKFTIMQQTDIWSEISKREDQNMVSYDLIVKTLLYGVVSTPFKSWDEEKIKWLDETNRDLLMMIFQEVINFNRPLEEMN